MNRRSFIATIAASSAAALEPARAERSASIAGTGVRPDPSIAVNHLGFLSDAQKTFVYRITGNTVPTAFVVRQIGFEAKPVLLTLPLKKVSGDFGEHLVGDFSQLDREGLYVAEAGGERSVPFFVRKDVWRRTLPKAVGYHKCQRCGIAVPNIHTACHLDDARRRDNGEYVDVTGGWHDAGDVR
jgi:hypothetical protein